MFYRCTRTAVMQTWLSCRLWLLLFKLYTSVAVLIPWLFGVVQQYVRVGCYMQMSCCCLSCEGFHDDVIKWKHFPRYWPFVWGIHRSPVNSPHKGQWRGALMFSLICAWINSCVNNREAGDLKRHRTHHDVTVIPQRSQCKRYLHRMSIIHWTLNNTFIKMFIELCVFLVFFFGLSFFKSQFIFQPWRILPS